MWLGRISPLRRSRACDQVARLYPRRMPFARPIILTGSRPLPEPRLTNIRSIPDALGVDSLTQRRALLAAALGFALLDPRERAPWDSRASRSIWTGRRKPGAWMR